MILRVYSYLYHLVLCLFLLGLAIVALISSNTLRLPMLPWSGGELTQWLLWGSLVGLISLLLAITGKFRFLFPIWALVVLFLMTQGYLLKPYSFEGTSTFYSVLVLIAGALLAFLGSLTLFRSRRRRA